MKITLEVEGTSEKSSALKHVTTGMPKALDIGLTAGMQPIASRMRAYPAQPAPRNPKHAYARTNKYRDMTIGPLVQYMGSGVEGKITSSAPHSIYVRGDLEGYPGAWMHLGVWQPVQEIVDEETPHIVERIQQQVDQLIEEAGLNS